MWYQRVEPEEAMCVCLRCFFDHIRSPLLTSSKPSSFWPLRLIAAFSLVAPAVIFSYAAWDNRTQLTVQADERIERSLDVLQEHAAKALQTVERSISEINEVLQGMSDSQIRAREADLFLRFKRTQQALPQIESIWTFDANGRPMVSSTIYPVPQNLDNSDRSYFRAQRTADVGTFIGEVVKAKLGSLHFFVVSGRRLGNGIGDFNGIIAVTVMPQHFSEFYRKLSRGQDAFALLRTDGTALARYPEVPLENLNVQPSPELADAIVNRPQGGIFVATSPIDGMERRIGIRQVPGFDLYVASAIDTAAISAAFWKEIATQLLIGLPAVLAMFGLSIYALRRAQLSEADALRRNAAEAALKQAQRLEAIGQLTGGVAHDFNNLLMVVDGNMRRIQRGVAADTLPRRAVEAIETAVKRGTELTRQLLSFSRRQTHEARVIDLRERLPAVREMLQSSLRGDIVVEARIPELLWNVKVDMSEFELSLLNLAVNARDAMPDGGRLTLAAVNIALGDNHPAGISGDFVAVSVQDTGKGIAPDVVARVFEPFFTTKDVGKGTGLGLSQVYGFAQQAGGTTIIDSEVGRGTTVTIYLPRSREPAEANGGEHAHDVTHPRERGVVLLVEDNSDVAEVTRGFLEDFGYSVLTAANVASAIELVKANESRLTVVVTDIVMPGGAGGLDLARYLTREYGHRVPVVRATGYSGHAQAAADEGYTLLRKPYTSAQLREAIAETLLKSAPARVA
jgi:two-component system, NtrC family, sensor kinase